MSAMPLNPPPFETSRCLCLAARRAARSITREFDQALRAHNLRATQFTLLSALSLAGPLPIGALADLLAAERTTITRGLALLSKRKLVAMHGDPDDARVHIAAITAAGHAVLRKAMPTWRAVQAHLTDALGAPAANALRQLAGGPCVMPLPDESPAASRPHRSHS